jgi:hypothetical protein
LRPTRGAKTRRGARRFGPVLAQREQEEIQQLPLFLCLPGFNVVRIISLPQRQDRRQRLAAQCIGEATKFGVTDVAGHHYGVGVGYNLDRLRLPHVDVEI